MPKRIYLVGAFPPPVCGVSVINAGLRNMFLDTEAQPIVIDLSTRQLGRRWSARASRLATVMKQIMHFMRLRPRAGDAIYISLSGGYGQAYDLLFAMLARSMRLAICLHHHSYAYLDHERRLTRWLMSVTGSRTTHVVATAGMGTRLRKLYPSCGHAIALCNAVFVEPLGPHATRTRRSVNVIGFLSNISEDKGIFEFLEVIRRLQAEGGNIAARIAGPFLEKQTAMRFRRALLTTQWVEYVGAKYGAAKTEFLNGVDVLLFPTKYVNETDPLTIHEAMAHGVPVIAYDRGSIAEQLHAKCGLVVDREEDFVESAVLQLKDWRASPNAFHNAAKEARARFHQLRDDGLNQWHVLRSKLGAGGRA